MNSIKDFDCVKFQREVRAKMLEEANYDLKRLAINIEKSLKHNDLYKFLIERKEKEKQQAAA